jgi:hypothetical protein
MVAMNDLLKVVLPALLTAIVAIMAGLIGYAKWRQKRKKTAVADFELERRSAYKAIWEKLEAIHFDLRMGMLAARDLLGKIQDLNKEIFILAPYLGDDLHREANSYVKEVDVFCQMVRSRGSEDDVVVLAGTQALGPDADMELREQEWRVIGVRNGIKHKVSASLKNEQKKYQVVLEWSRYSVRQLLGEKGRGCRAKGQDECRIS